MKVTIEYMGFLDIPGTPNRSEVEVPEEHTVQALLDKIGVKEQDRTFLVPIVNKKRKDFATKLEDGDSLFLYYPVGGG